MPDLTLYTEETFESIKHINEAGQEFWYARELQPILGYTQWRRFEDAIERLNSPVKIVVSTLTNILPTSQIISNA